MIKTLEQKNTKMRYNGSTQEREEFVGGGLKTTMLKENEKLILGMTSLNM